MKSSRRWFQAILSALLLVAVGAAWVVFAPNQLGGGVGYIIVQGSSMEPGFHFGDLVLVRQAQEYRVGEAAAYFSARLNSPVFHRIIGLDGSRYVFQGDSNTWVDSYLPTREEIIGREWLHLPGFGRVFQWLRRPAVLAALAGAGGVVLMSGKGREKPSRRGKRSTAGRPSRQPAGRARFPGGLFEMLFFAFGLTGFAALALGLFAFTRPPTVAAARTIEYRQAGQFSYTASAPLGIYDSTLVTTGQPVFPALTCSLLLRFDYSLTGEGLEPAGGVYRLEAVLRDERTGWERTLPLGDETAFEGAGFISLVPVNVCELESLAAEMEEKVGLGSGLYSLTILPRVTSGGRLAGQSFTDRFAPRLTFQMDARVLSLARSSQDGDPLRPEQVGQVQAFELQANTATALGRTFEVAGLRRAAAWGLGLSLAGLVSLLLAAFLVGRRSRADLIRVRYGAMLVEAAGREAAGGLPAIELAGIEDLARLAERLGLPILHATEGSRHRYWVENGNLTYDYLLDETPPPGGKGAGT